MRDIFCLNVHQVSSTIYSRFQNKIKHFSDFKFSRSKEYSIGSTASGNGLIQDIGMLKSNQKL